VKVCGLTREDDVDACLEQGVDWIGLVFAERSPRRITPERGRVLRMKAKGEAGGERGGGDSGRSAPGAVRGVVAVFAEDTPAAEIERVLDVVRPDVLQMANPPCSLSKGTCSGTSLWHTVRVGRDDLACLDDLSGDALHFDTSVGGVTGGTGTAFDWSLLDVVPRSRPIVLAGGLTPANVASAVRRVKPDIVDVASGVESAPGIKEAAKIATFVKEVRRA
jgi:phosphoribosylanthranilate isomerase